MNDEAAQSAMSVASNRQALEALAFASTRLMEIAASVLVRIDSTEEKLTLSREIWILSQTSQLVRDRVAGLRTAEVSPRPANRGYVDFTNMLVSLQNPISELAGLLHLGYPDLRNAVLQHRSRLLAVADEATLDCLTTILGKFDGLRIKQGPAPHCLYPMDAVLQSCGGALGKNIPKQTTQPPAASDQLNPPLPALPMIPIRPGREVRLHEALPGQPVKQHGYGPALHDYAFRIELCAAEICASMLAHHSDAPWGLRYDLAKQTRDEARHFELFIERVRELGLRPGDCPIQFEVWDKFVVGRDLPERIIIEQRIGEGGALDSAEKISRKLKADGENGIALVFDYIIADEVSHVANGNKWLRKILGDDEAIFTLEDELRHRLAASGMPVPYKHPINFEDRALSGFTTAEIARIQRVQAEENESNVTSTT